MNNKGFTLIELLVTITIMAILLSVAVPSFSDFIRNNRMGSVTNDMVTLLKYARLEAMRIGARVYVSPINEVSVANEWGNGVRIWLDGNNDTSYDSGEEIRIVNLSSGDNDVDVAGGAANFYFSAQGSTSLTADVKVNICDQRTGETGRQISILTSGLVSINNAYSCT
jgi:type IV fimbrial biogenesis protein FimT